MKRRPMHLSAAADCGPRTAAPAGWRCLGCLSCSRVKNAGPLSEDSDAPGTSFNLIGGARLASTNAYKSNVQMVVPPSPERRQGFNENPGRRRLKLPEYGINRIDALRHIP